MDDTTWTQDPVTPYSLFFSIDMNDTVYDWTLSFTQKVLFITLDAFFAVFILATNGLILFLMSRNKSLRTERNAFVLSLVAANILAGLIALPAVCLAQFTSDSSGALCKTYEYFIHLADSAEVFTLCYIAHDRYKAVVAVNKESRKSLKTLCVWIGIIWLVSVVYAAKAPFIFDREILYFVEGNGKIHRSERCALDHVKYETTVKVSLVVDFFLLFVFPLLLIVTYYCLIYTKLGQSAITDKTARRRKKVFKILVGLISTFFFCNVPLEILVIYINIGPGPFRGSHVLELGFEALAFLNFGLNALIYALLNEKFRATLTVMMMRRGLLRRNAVRPLGDAEATVQNQTDSTTPVVFLKVTPTSSLRPPATRPAASIS